MISLKSLLKTIKDAKITEPRKGVDTPLDARIQVEGCGVMTRKQLQNSIQRYIAEVAKYLRNGQTGKAYSTLYGKKVLKSFLEADLKHGGEIK